MKTPQPPPIKPWTSARFRLFLLVLLVVVPALGVQVYGAWSDLQQNIEERKQESVRVIEHANSDYERLLADIRVVFSDLVRLNDMRTPYNCTQIFTGLRFGYERLAPEIANLGLADSHGNIYCAINPVQGGRNLASQPDFQLALQTLNLASGKYGINPSDGSPIMRVIYPVLSFDGEVQTVIFATIEINWLKNWQSEVALPPDTSVTLLAEDGRVLWRSVDGQAVPVAGLTGQTSSWYRALQAGSASVESPDFDGVVRLHTMIRLDDSATLHLGYPVNELYSQAYANLRWKLALLGLVVVAAFGLAWWGSQTMFFRPLQNLLNVVERVQKGDLGARVSSLRGLGELTELANSFDQMTDALQQREAERQQMEERFRAAFESSAIGMGLLTLDGGILDVNAAICQMSGYTREELRQRNDSQNVYPPDAQMGLDLFAEMMEGKRHHYSVERRYIRKNGEIFWTRLTLTLVRDAQGQPAYIIGQIEDIDEQKRKSIALAESEARFRIMFETSAIGIGLMGLDGKVIDANPALCKMYGYELDELLGQTSALVLHPESAERALGAMQRMLAGEFNHFSDERRYVRKNGEAFWARVTMSMVRDDADKPLYIVGMVADINEERLALAKLRESEARFRSMFDNAAVGVAVMGTDRRQITEINETALHMTGYSRDEIREVNPSLLAVEEDRFIDQEQFTELASGQRDQYTVEKRYRRRNGEIFWGRVNFAAVRGADGKPLYTIGIIEDITDEKQTNEKLAAQEADYRRLLEERIAQRTEELNKANEMLRVKAAQDAVLTERTRLARDLHDAVTQTLFSTTLIADVLPEIWAMNPEEGKRRLEEVRQLTRGALAEMRTLLVELRPNALVEVPLPTLLRQLTEAMTGRARINIQLSAEGERKLPADVQVGLYRIAQEALNNVVKHARASMAVVTLRLGDSVRLTVADNGSGFDPNMVTADHLGLKIMRERAEAIGAKFSVYSEPGEGTQLSVTWL